MFEVVSRTHILETATVLSFAVLRIIATLPQFLFGEAIVFACQEASTEAQCVGYFALFWEH
jgi:hypothetical protein